MTLSRHNAVGMLLAAGLVLAWLTPPGMAQSGPATAAEASPEFDDNTPMTMPGTASASAPDTAPLPRAANIREGLRLDWAESMILQGVRDDSSQFIDNGLYVLLRRAACLPELNQAQYDSLSHINTDELMDAPATYRARPLRLSMRVYKVDKKWPGADFPTSPRWPRDKPIWWVGGADFTSKRQIIVLSLDDPSPVLGEPETTQDGGKVLMYPMGPRLEVAGLFYKVYQDMSVGGERNPPALMSYPVIVGWQVGRTSLPSGGIDYMWFAALVSLAILAALFFVFRRRASQAKKATPNVGWGDYRPLRDDAAAPSEKTSQADNPDVQQVDPALREAAERFRKERGNG